MGAYIGTGSTITRGSDSIMNVIGIRGPGQSRTMIDVSNLSTTSYRKKLPGKLRDAGELTLNVAYDPADDASFKPSGTFASTVITWGTSGVTWTFQSAIQSRSRSIPLEDQMTCDITLKVKGAITVASS